MTVAIVSVYLAVLLIIGVVSSRRGARTAEDYFLASRSFGTVVLFMALFGTNVTAFALLGLPGLAYHKGVSVFGYFGAAAAFWSPLMFILLGYPIWNIGKRNGYLTPSQMFRDRWRSATVGWLVFALLVFYTVPYLVVGVMGGALALNGLADVSYPVGAALVTVVTLTYTSLGGMRGTAWTNVFQGIVFIAFLVLACVGIAQALGGAASLHERIAETKPELLGKGFPMANWATAFLIGPVSVIAFPHMFLRLLAAKDGSSLRRTVLIYPAALMLLFVPVTLIGVWGAVEVPGLEGKASDKILPMLVAEHLPAWASAVGLAAILAAVMSSLDGQILTLSTLTTVDLIAKRARVSPRTIGRVVVVVLAILAYLLALLRVDSIFAISKYAFSGFTLVIPILFAAFFWKRSTATAVIVASLASHGLLALYYVGQWWPQLDPKLPTWNLLPVAICLLVELVLLVLVSVWTQAPGTEATDRFARPFGSSASADDHRSNPSARPSTEA